MKINSLNLTTLLLLLLFLPTQKNASAKTNSSIKTPYTQAQFFSEYAAIQPNQPFWLGLQFKLTEAWHTYYKNPGDAGQGLKIKWTLPKGFRISAAQYPLPKRIAANSLMTFGYENEVIFFWKVFPSVAMDDSIKRVNLSAQIQWLVCKEICVPQKGQLSLELLVQNDSQKLKPNPNLPDHFSWFFSQLPQMVPTTEIQLQDHQQHLKLTIPKKYLGNLQHYLDIEFFPDQAGILDHLSKPKINTDTQSLHVKLKKDPKFTHKTNFLSGALKLSSEEAMDILGWQIYAVSGKGFWNQLRRNLYGAPITKP